MVCGVDHVAIAAKHSRVLTDWYCKILGMRVVFDNGKTPPTCLVGGDMGAVIEIMPDNANQVSGPKIWNDSVVPVRQHAIEDMGECFSGGKLLGG